MRDFADFPDSIFPSKGKQNLGEKISHQPSEVLSSRRSNQYGVLHA